MRVRDRQQSERERQELEERGDEREGIFSCVEIDWKRGREKERRTECT